MDDCLSLIVDQLSVQNCARILTHDEVAHHKELSRQVCGYIVKRFADVVRAPSSRQQLLQMPRNQIVYMVRELCRRCDNNRDTDLIVRFVVDWSSFDTACDLLRDCKLWDWAVEPGALSIFRDEDTPLGAVPSSELYLNPGSRCPNRHNYAVAGGNKPRGRRRHRTTNPCHQHQR